MTMLVTTPEIMKTTSAGSVTINRRSNNASAVSSSATNIQESSSSITDKEIDHKSNTKILTLNQVAPHLRFNKYVLSHYRPPMNVIGCLRSLFYMHNETVNIITHAIPVFVILANIPTCLPWKELEEIPYLPQIHVVATIAPWIGSVLYHLFMNHKQGYKAYKLLLTIDIIGIWVTQSLGGLVTIIASMYCFDYETRRNILIVYGVLCLFCLKKAISAESPWERRFSFAAPTLFRFVMFLIRILAPNGGGHPDAINHVILQDVLSVIGGVIGGSNIPERWFPGSLDLFFNSHNLMHVVVVYAVYHMHLASSLDMKWMTNINQNPQMCNIMMST